MKGDRGRRRRPRGVRGARETHPRRRAAGGRSWLLAAGLLALSTAGAILLATAVGGGARAASPAPVRLAADSGLIARGEHLYLTGCVSCHGVGGAGTHMGPSLLDAGEAGADFYLRTGRMPLAFPAPQPPDKPRAYDDAEIRALVAYVGSLGEGPPIPEVAPEMGRIQQGARLFLANCAGCHNSSAIGGALSHGNYAPTLHHTDTVQIAEAMRVGPGQMPEFGPDVLSDHQVDSIVRYVRYLRAPDDPGGLNLGYTGPVPEGFVAFLFGLGGLILIARWITKEKEPPGA